MRTLFATSFALSLISSVAAQAASIQGGAAVAPLIRVGVVQARMPPIVSSVAPAPSFQARMPPVVSSIAPAPSIQAGAFPPRPGLGQTVAPIAIGAFPATIQAGVSLSHLPPGYHHESPPRIRPMPVPTGTLSLEPYGRVVESFGRPFEPLGRPTELGF